MNIGEWWGYYSQIIVDFSFDPWKDYISSLILSGILGNRSTTGILQEIKGKNVIVVGNGENLHSILDSIPEGLVMVADSALDTFLESKECPDLIVTDLDGDMGKIASCASRRSTLIIHSHGDNIDQLGKLEGTIKGNVVGTTQNIPLWNIFNFGGFTDGDRAAFLADTFGADKITLAGFDFERPNPDKKSDPEIKRKKLQWARILLSHLAEKRNADFQEGDFIDI